jgi:hypothetical protein
MVSLSISGTLDVSYFQNAIETTEGNHLFDVVQVPL